ncbi:unnamed protein product [Rotaria socialis]|uniref:Uncharacterized protein n=1 Tax=Rotaria socialis TaxID=392032 RepID=A0A818U7G7_9BILA|nr:unnamed protein product [Rotaria socialis]CAF3315447.1 unnamed protein product [Rotaria socialis]CAF3343018.1 unnamed protein product [Rotaria socialis]CAF3694479.1 unnamed protein product [Rotaria socialis]CAF3752201.1 unnamed protein product [Rotaria socialis]
MSSTRGRLFHAQCQWIALKSFSDPNQHFLIEAVNGKDISGYADNPTESEVILCPGTRLRVVNDPLDQAPMRVVHLQEITDEAEDQLTSGFDEISAASSFETKSILTTATAKSSDMKTVTDPWNNIYEKNIQIL